MSIKELLELVSKHGLVRSRDLTLLGVTRVTLTRAVRQGHLERIGRGLYGLPTRSLSAHTSLMEVALRVPRGVVCLLSALRFHELTTQAPYQVWLAIPHKSTAPRLDYPPLRIVRADCLRLTSGVETHIIDGVQVNVFCIGRTVIDCFKFRNKIGIDVALEALSEAWQNGRVSSDELWRYAKICRVQNIIRPYLEALL
ncbi:type IV toxin-antitoxin system AbiEi family antitoxin domain-containing protein [Stenotrophomonas acidaminiphila]